MGTRESWEEVKEFHWRSSQERWEAASTVAWQVKLPMILATHGHWCESQLLHFQHSSQKICLRKQQQMAQVLRPLGSLRIPTVPRGDLDEAPGFGTSPGSSDHFTYFSVDFSSSCIFWFLIICQLHGLDCGYFLPVCGLSQYHCSIYFRYFDISRKSEKITKRAMRKIDLKRER